MKKFLLILSLAFGIFVAHPKTTLAYIVCTSTTQTNCCQSTMTNSCSSPQGLCIGSTVLCCSDEATCKTTDLNASWIPATPGPGQTPTPVPVADICRNQPTGGCTDPALPQACSYGVYYDCCNTLQACYNLPGIPVPKANPTAPPGTPSSTLPPYNTGLWCGSVLSGKINTAIGCVPVFSSASGQNAFLSFLLKWAVGIGGGIAFLLVVYAGFMIMTAAGNPERLKAGQELLTSAISGLILLVFSIFILKLIGVDILQLCKFGFGPAC